MKIEIETATNGYIITIPAEYEDSGYINDICSEDKRWEFQQQMKQSLANPKNDLGD